MNKFKIIAGTSLMSVLLVSSVAFAATTDTTVTKKAEPTQATPTVNISTKLTSTQKACIKTATESKTTSMKAAKDTYTQAMKDAKKITSKTAMKTAKASARKAYSDAKEAAKTDYTAAKAVCMK